LIPAANMSLYSVFICHLFLSCFFRLWIPLVRGQPHGFSFCTPLCSLHPTSWAASFLSCTWRHQSAFFFVFSCSVVHECMPPGFAWRNHLFRQYLFAFSFRCVFSSALLNCIASCEGCEWIRSLSSSWMNRRQTDTALSAALLLTSVTVRLTTTGHWAWWFCFYNEAFVIFRVLFIRDISCIMYVIYWFLPYTGWANKKRGSLLLSILSPVIDFFFHIFLLTHSADNLQYASYNTVNESLHYLVKYRWKCIYNDNSKQTFW